MYTTAFRLLSCGGFLLGMLLGACERPFVEEVAPGLTMISPDLTTVLTDPTLSLSVSAASFRPIERVVLNGTPMTFDPVTNLWVITINLDRGLNTLVISAFDVEDVARVDTAYAVYLPFRFILRGPSLPEPRGGHTATLMQDSRILVTGGATIRDGPAEPDAFVLASGGTRFERLSARLNHARTGHTATLLPDGRVLFLGGSRSENLRTITDLVETAELFDPATGRFEVVPFSGQPIRRTLHTASLRTSDDGLLIDLYGGRGDVRYDEDSRLGTRRDLRTFLLTSDSLIALNTIRSAPFLDAAISGHTQTLLGSLGPGLTGRYLILGSFIDNLTVDDVSFILDFTSPPDIFITEAPPLPTSRTRHAAATVRRSLLAFFGGHQDNPTSVLNRTEFYSDEAAQFFHLPQPEASARRFGHTATNLSARRILLLGGFATDGTAFAGSEFFDSTFSN